MRWQGRRESENVEDRRGMGGGFGGFGGGYPGGGMRFPIGRGGGLVDARSRQGMRRSPSLTPCRNVCVQRQKTLTIINKPTLAAAMLATKTAPAAMSLASLTSGAVSGCK
jgi:predicted metalloprotease